ncbi:MAG: hypothetical protein P1U77_16855 [Rubripirellula sp.]|nr:hypothetical protein [Rubripirellula sp.]
MTSRPYWIGYRLLIALAFGIEKRPGYSHDGDEHEPYTIGQHVDHHDHHDHGYDADHDHDH